ncbi:PREDICTED: probable disease resistance protein At5g66900 [Fragaria vesca subsp. vesca]|uniref:probable disease resistance protein At5g66900 n=1 Tax=Fragaria vesca subsp. vesca TaxID=101020 RepID=UPI0002C370AE|nr:PREDICTED: probable disease resistance protein At5g66900 [Fragaria vesca subsp. vesca]XP_011464526.1 PREDICTED: probable disease resistance protein At5g66900 [Fragaria vesca subsp. vesca]XP_011464532.1 PREDICTED: probable disease resistance protein At5g66900 [Fragaria vesca subsp. vesca]XP_011464537.1 PREDICTED: probable disease resistance protein At5g66900 [Fragaria vesca subsp. vesca]XP_011464540.1 PREDICTED: probable disease resistance protein At5g66900 [Fragaria vesca subsp. vesca]XP_01
MADLAAGGAMGLPFTVLYEVIKEVVIKTAMFEPLLKELDFTIDSLKPLIEEMDKYNKVLDRPEKELREFKVQMEKGPELIRKCANLSKWQSYKKYKYSNQLLELQNSLQKLQFLLSVQQARDVKQTLAVTKNIETVVLRIDGEGPAGWKEGMNDMKETLEEVKIITGTMVKRIDQKGEVQSQIDSEVPASPRVTVGLDVPLMELKMKLLKDDEVTMLVLTAPGGSGKTTLATKFCQDKDVQGKFKNNIFFFTVSKKSNFNLIVQGLHQRKSTDVPSFPDEATAVKWLHKFLKEEDVPVLLVLDDVWSESKSILETFDEVKMPNFKILVTSRSQFPGYGSLYHLQSLNDIDAMKLLRHSASLGDGSFNFQWNRLAKKIVEHCKGYPLAIDVVGKSLRGKSYELWCKREMELSKSDSIIDSETEVLLRLKSSLDALNEQEAIIKECFVDLGSFPEGQRIPVVALIDMWAELHEGLGKDVLAVANLQELTSQSLADLVVTRKEIMEVDDYYSEHFVTQHDLLRQLAVYEAKLDSSKKRLIIGNCGDNLPKCLTEQKDQLIKPRLLSISSDETFSTNLHNIHLAAVEVLVLNFNAKNYALPEFVEKMINLKVLIITNHGFLPAELSNFHLLDSLPNLKRIRLERVSIPSITKNSIQLKSLKKISLFMCSIGQAFSNCSFDISDALPNLEELNIDYCNDFVGLPDTICNLVRLRKLSITNCHKLSALPKEIGKLDMLEVLRLRSCTDLVKLPCSVMNLGSLSFLDISDCFSIVELPEDIGDLSGLRKINMSQCSRLKELPLSVLDFENIEEVICDEETKELWEPFLPMLHSVAVRVVKQEFNLNWLQKSQF